MMIEELPDIKVSNYCSHMYRQEPLLEYVWEVAVEFLPFSTLVPNEGTSLAPATFANRYAESTLTDEERYVRYKEVYKTNDSFEEYTKKKYSKLNTSFKDNFLQNKDLQNTIEAFGLDVSKFWYLLLFVYDYIEDLSANILAPGNKTLDEFNVFNIKLKEATEIRLKKDGRKSYETDREDIMRLIKTALGYFISSYNEILEQNSTREEQMEHLKKLGLSDYIINGPIPIPTYWKEQGTLDKSHKISCFAKMFLFFLENRKAKTLPHVKEKVSKDKMLFVSRLLYIVGYVGEEYNDEYDKEANKNRMLSKLLRKYGKEEFPIRVSKYY
ncbi:MAG: hypothetical protein J6B82_07330 [Bacteroidaceae bacterium]|nr:hypothetical protein [Bacteroidaceae bacterium]